jgi:hypothetical protein
MNHYEQKQLQAVADRAAARTYDLTRHKCFISHHAGDKDEVAKFLDDFGTEFIAKTIGVTNEDDFIDSQNTDYVMDRIRTNYLGDSSVTIVLMGRCTWARRYVDWEVYSSLRNSRHSKVNGLLAIQLPSVAATGTKLQDRINDNVKRDVNGTDVGYARWYVYPGSKSTLRAWIEDAYSARTSRAHLIVNDRARRLRSADCP